MLSNKRILLGITGGIAAYKSAYLIRLLIKNNASVKTIMTPSAKEFITPLTISTLSRNPVLTDFFDPENGSWNSHVDIANWADLFVIAPATANTIGKMSNGIADNLLLTTYLSVQCPVILAPAMDYVMYNHPANKNNLSALKKHGCIIIDPSKGELASGLTGKGRMAEPEIILNKILSVLSEKKKDKSQKLSGKKILITAGPTQEAIDPVRYISNHSTGKMGYALANTLASAGADITLVSGPCSQHIVNDSVKIIPVTSAMEMYNACTKIFSGTDIAILSAAVADYTPVSFQKNKIKRKKSDLSLQLKATPDIAESLGKMKKKNQIIVGFALENENETANAIQKLKKKNFDFIVLNSLNDKGAGFGFDTNKITILDKNNNKKIFPLKDKNNVANDITSYLTKLI